MSHKLPCLNFSLLTGEGAIFLSVLFRVVAVGYQNSFYRFLHPFFAYIAERWYFLKREVEYCYNQDGKQ